jgi:hypothetical protein
MAGEPADQWPFKCVAVLLLQLPRYSERQMTFAIAVDSEAAAMTDSAKSSLLAIAQTGGHAYNRAVPLVKAAVLAVSVAAAIPTAQNLYYSWKNDVPFNQVQHRLSQAALWEKNFDCKIDYRVLSSSGMKVEVGSCSKTQDISIKMTANKGQVNYEWIAFDQLPKPQTQTAGLLDMIVSSALAEELAKPASGTGGLVHLAQAGMEVMCQAKKGSAVVRVVKEGGKCVRETVSLFKGSVEKREEVPCDKACPVAN